MGAHHSDDHKQEVSRAEKPQHFADCGLPHINRALSAVARKQAERCLVKRAKRCPIVSENLENHVLQHPVFNNLLLPTQRFVVPDTIRAVALDFDGTTVELQTSEGLRQKAWREAIRKVGLQTRGSALTREEIEDCHRPALHKTEKEMSAIIAGELQKLTKCWVAESQMWSEWIGAQQSLRNSWRSSIQSSVVKGMVNFLEEAKLRGIPASHVTMGADQLVQPLLQHAGIQDLLNPVGNVFINRNPEIRGKPHPDPYLLACEKLNVQPHELLVFEDSSTGALSGFRAGAHVLLQPSVNRAKTLLEIQNALMTEDPQLLSSRPGAITVLARKRGWTQVTFPNEC